LIKLYNQVMSIFSDLSVKRGGRAVVAAIAVFFSLFPVRAVFSGADDGGLGLGIEAGPVPGREGSVWTVTILVEHPNPAEVRVTPPALPSSLRLERIRILPRLGGGERRTVVECDFVVLREAGFTLGPFEVAVPGRCGLTRPFTVYAAGSVSPLPEDMALPRLFWAVPQDALRIGGTAEIALRYEYPPGASLPAETRAQSAAAWSYRPGLPVNAILETLPGPPLPDSAPTPDRGETGVLLRLRVIPLEGRLLSLPETRLILAGRSLSVPPLELRLHGQ
jgi:hypothetical protein